MRRILVVLEMAMSLVLLVGASLLTQSIVRLEHQNLGIRADHSPPASFNERQGRVCRTVLTLPLTQRDSN